MTELDLLMFITSTGFTITFSALFWMTKIFIKHKLHSDKEKMEMKLDIKEVKMDVKNLKNSK